MALEKAVQLGMPYSTGQQGLPANLKHIKNEIIKQENIRLGLEDKKSSCKQEGDQ